MPDLHGWITQRVDAHERLAREQQGSLWDMALGDDSVATTVLRRCAADRKILEVHAPAGTKWDPYACNGCGVDSEYGHEVGHTNDCETLLALAEGYGLTPEILAGLDRPEPERPVYSGGSGSVIGDSIASLYADLYKGLLASTFTAAEAERLVVGDGTGAPLGFFTMADVPEPSPGERAFAILEPHLTDNPLYRPRGRTLR